MKIRSANADDARGISLVLQLLVTAKLRTKSSDQKFALDHYIAHPDSLACLVAEENNDILGFQSLRLATQGNPYGVEIGWGIIGTHIRPDAARRGIGKALFASTKIAAKEAGISRIDASIGMKNSQGLAYYNAMGFRSYREFDGTICKYFSLT